MVNVSKRCLLRWTRISKKRLIIVSSLFVLFFIMYQMKSFLVLSRSKDEQLESRRVPRPKLKDPDEVANGQQQFFNVHIPNRLFQCFKSKERIPVDQVNDDYCDCKDGSDESKTNACGSTWFTCATGHVINYPKHKLIPSSRVNDGICDCCDGSDEWKIRSSPRGLKTQQLMVQKFSKIKTVPCPYSC